VITAFYLLNYITMEKKKLIELLKEATEETTID